VSAFIEAGTVVHGRGNHGAGVATGKTRLCTLSGCTGLRIVVKWPDGHITWPCSKGMRKNEDGSWSIE
jgi:hypothetical protein